MGFSLMTLFLAHHKDDPKVHTANGGGETKLAFVSSAALTL